MLNEDIIDKIELRKDYVLLELERYGGIEEHAGGIYSITTKRFKEIAKVLKVGKGRYTRKGNFIKTELKPGDKVYLANPAKCEFVCKKGDKLIGICPEGLIDAVVVED